MRFCVLWFIAAASLSFAQTALPKASELKGAAGQEVLYRFQTLPDSVQIYTCKAASPGGAYAWTGPDPDAILTTGGGNPIVHHYKGPTWEATDGSIVHASHPVHFEPTHDGAVDWLELTAAGGTRKFARVSTIHRIETSGGVPPRSACDPAHDAEQVRVPYHATYLFYGPNGK